MTADQLQRLQRAPLRTCQKLHGLLQPCRVCGGAIRLSEEYRDGWGLMKAHRTCVTEAVLPVLRAVADGCRYDCMYLEPDEQPISVRMTLGDYRRAVRILAELERAETGGAG